MDGNFSLPLAYLYALGSDSLWNPMAFEVLPQSSDSLFLFSFGFAYTIVCEVLGTRGMNISSTCPICGLAA
jgi:hypothetical protein